MRSGSVSPSGSKTRPASVEVISRSGDGGEAPPDRRPDRDGGEALLGVAAVLLEVLGGQGADQAALLGVEMAEGLEVVGQGTGLVAGPGVEGGHELGLVDQPDLEGQ